MLTVTLTTERNQLSLCLLSDQFSKAILLDYEDVFKKAITRNRFIDYTGNTNHKPHLPIFEQVREFAFFVACGIGFPVTTSTHQQYPVE